MELEAREQPPGLGVRHGLALLLALLLGQVSGTGIPDRHTLKLVLVEDVVQILPRESAGVGSGVDALTTGGGSPEGEEMEVGGVTDLYKLVR